VETDVSTAEILLDGAVEAEIEVVLPIKPTPLNCWGQLTSIRLNLEDYFDSTDLGLAEATLCIVFDANLECA
jgi:hypothetical protein